MIPILTSYWRHNFTDVEDGQDLLNLIQLAEKEEAADLWRRYFGLDVKGFHQFPNDSWIAGKWEVIGAWWSQAEGLTGLMEVSNSIAKATGWSANESLLFVQDRSRIISCSFGAFSKFWQELLETFDDGPSLISQNKNCKSIFWFTPLGQILMGSYSVVST